MTHFRNMASQISARRLDFGRRMVAAKYHPFAGPEPRNSRMPAGDTVRTHVKRQPNTRTYRAEQDLVRGANPQHLYQLDRQPFHLNSWHTRMPKTISH
jgi:hypothetical protein